MLVLWGRGGGGGGGGGGGAGGGRGGGGGGAVVVVLHSHAHHLNNGHKFTKQNHTHKNPYAQWYPCMRRTQPRLIRLDSTSARTDHIASLLKMLIFKHQYHTKKKKKKKSIAFHTNFREYTMVLIRVNADITACLLDI